MVYSRKADLSLKEVSVDEKKSFYSLTKFYLNETEIEALIVEIKIAATPKRQA